MSTTRRRLLLGGASVALAGCGASPEPDDSAPGESETGRRADAEVLRAALEEKQVAGLHARRVEGRLGRLQDEHVKRLAVEIRGLGGPEPRDGFLALEEGDELRGAVMAVERSIANLQDLLPKLSDRDLRSLLARMLVVDAEMLAVLRRRQGEQPAPDAFLAPEASG